MTTGKAHGKKAEENDKHKSCGLGWVGFPAGLNLLTKEHLAVVSGLAGALELVVVHLGVRGAEVGPKPLGWLLRHFHSDLKISRMIRRDRQVAPAIQLETSI